MASFTITRTGMFAGSEGLNELPKATARNVLQRVLKKAAEPVHDSMQAGAPKLTGALQVSIITGPSSKLTSRQKRDA